MLSVFICEDDLKQRERLEWVIQNYIMIEALDMTLVLSTGDPEEVLNYMTQQPKTTGLYFLDVDLQHNMSGIALASEIRELDDSGKIVFVTTHGELSYLTFTYKVEAMDYIIKNKLEETDRRVRECMTVAYQRHLSDKNGTKKILKIRVGDKIRSISYQDIMFFESSVVPHKLILHMDNRQLEFYGSIKEAELYDESLYRCHKSFVVNKNNIKRIEKGIREIEMINGEIVLVSVRAMKGLK